MNKRGVSAVIAAVLLIMITVIAAGMIFSFVIPFVKQQTESATECFDVFGGLEFASTAYNCNVLASASGCGTDGTSACFDRTGFSIKVSKEGIEGLKVSLVAGGSSTALDIKSGEEVSGLLMLDGTESLEVPQSGETRTYVANDTYESAEVAAILENGRTCDVSDNIVFSACLGDIAVEVGTT